MMFSESCVDGFLMENANVVLVIFFATMFIMSNPENFEIERPEPLREALPSLSTMKQSTQTALLSAIRAAIGVKSPYHKLPLNDPLPPSHP
jgi:hypothetical protein